MSHRRVSSKRRMSLTNDDSDKRQRSEEGSHMSIGRSPVPPRDGNTTPPPAASSGSSSLKQELGPAEMVSARHDYSSSTSSSPASSDDGDASRTATRRPTSGPRAPTWQTDAPAPDQRQWPREQRTSLRAREEDSRDRDRERLDLRDAVSSRPSGSDHHKERRSPSGGPYSSNQLAQPPVKTQAAFVGKLYSMLEDDKIRKSGLLHWSQDGSSFVCPNPTEFSKEVLPNYFKHNNWQSFVRQLNMYSFNKVSDLYSTANADPQAWEFRHPLFRRGEPQMLASIKRKSNRQNQDNVPHTSAPHSTTSPNEDDVKPIAWAPTPHPVPRFSPPSREYPTSSRPYYAHARPPSREFDTNDQPLVPNNPSSSHGRLYPSESPAAHPEAVFHPGNAGRSTNVEALSTQLATLQDTVNRLCHTINTERAENARTNLELTMLLLRQNQWLVNSSRELRLPHDILHRSQQELHQRYETLQASEMLSNMANIGRGPTAPAASLDHSRPATSYEQPRPTSSYEPRPPSSYDQRPHTGYDHRGSSAYDPPPRGLQQPMRDRRDGRAIHTSGSMSRRPPSPTYDHRPATIEHASSHSPRTYPSHQRVPGYQEYDFRFRPPAVDSRERDHDHDRGLPPARTPLSRRLTDPPAGAVDDVSDQPKTSLRNLLH